MNATARRTVAGWASCRSLVVGSARALFGKAERHSQALGGDQGEQRPVPVAGDQVIDVHLGSPSLLGGGNHWNDPATSQPCMLADVATAGSLAGSRRPRLGASRRGSP